MAILVVVFIHQISHGRNIEKQEIRSVEHGICPIAEFTSP